jgi:hypothetical protein
MNIIVSMFVQGTKIYLARALKFLKVSLFLFLSKLNILSRILCFYGIIGQLLIFCVYSKNKLPKLKMVVKRALDISNVKVMTLD